MKDFYYTKFYNIDTPDDYSIWKVLNDGTQECCIHPSDEYEIGRWVEAMPPFNYERQDRITEEEAFLLML